MWGSNSSDPLIMNVSPPNAVSMGEANVVTITQDETLEEQAEGWSLITRSGKSSFPRRQSSNAMVPTSDVATNAKSQQGFGVLADVTEEGEIVETDEDHITSLGKNKDIVEHVSVGPSKSASKNRVKTKSLRRPVLHKKDLLQAYPPLTTKNASSRKH